MPRCSLVAIRELRMPPSAPASSRNGGTSTSSAGNTRKDSMRFSIVMPAITSTAPAIASTGTDSRTMLRRIGRRARNPTTSATSPAATQIAGDQRA